MERQFNALLFFSYSFFRSLDLKGLKRPKAELDGGSH
jgi:hypothetical protein